MSNPTKLPETWLIGVERTVTLDRAQLMGIVNVTPDSFSDGGTCFESDAAVGHALRLVESGASIIDIGGESTRPGAERVHPDEQIRRTVPVIESIRAQSDVAISIDTTRAAVAAAALDAGADIINDVSAAQEDDTMLVLATERRCGLVLMHRLAPPDEESYSDQYAKPPEYEDVAATVRDTLVARAAAAVAAGVDRRRIVLDPGLGFGKSVEQNLALVRETGRLHEAGFPLLSAASRKSFIGAVAGVSEPLAREPGSLAISVLHWQAGVRLFRVHDVAAHRQALQLAAAAGPIGCG